MGGGSSVSNGSSEQLVQIIVDAVHRQDAALRTLAQGQGLILQSSILLGDAQYQEALACLKFIFKSRPEKLIQLFTDLAQSFVDTSTKGGPVVVQTGNVRDMLNDTKRIFVVIGGFPNVYAKCIQEQNVICLSAHNIPAISDNVSSSGRLVFIFFTLMHTIAHMHAKELHFLAQNSNSRDNALHCTTPEKVGSFADCGVQFEYGMVGGFMDVNNRGNITLTTGTTVESLRSKEIPPELLLAVGEKMRSANVGADTLLACICDTLHYANLPLHLLDVEAAGYTGMRMSSKATACNSQSGNETIEGELYYTTMQTHFPSKLLQHQLGLTKVRLNFK